MAIRRIGSVHQEIGEARSRLIAQSWDIAGLDVETRLSELKFLIDSGRELRRHVVVSLIATLQTFHRSTIISIVNSSNEFKTRAAKNFSEKLSIQEALNVLDGNSVTFGELVAYSAPCNSVTDIVSWLGVLLDCDFAKMAANAFDPFDIRNQVKNPQKIIRDIDKTLANMSEAFRLRHILAHEAAPSLEINSSTCHALHTAIEEWVSAVDGVLWSTVYKDLPLTQKEMNERAFLEVQNARKRLAAAMRAALAHAKLNCNAHWLRINHFNWMQCTKDWYRNTYGSMQGSVWFSVGHHELSHAINNRTNQIIEWNKANII